MNITNLVYHIFQWFRSVESDETYAYIRLKEFDNDR